MTNEIASQKLTPIIFAGKAREYFGIWIVNLLLSLVTLGVYSAWAKVRRKKYFYNNTLIDGVGFDYHAKPLSILKGRAIAFVFFACYVFGQYAHPFLPLLCLLVFFFALPWLVVRASMFNARNTSHRGLRFDFIGKAGQAARVFVWMPIFTVLTLGLGTPYSSHQKNNFFVNNHQFGLSQFDMHATVKDFYKVYLSLYKPIGIASLIFLIVLIISSFVASNIPSMLKLGLANSLNSIVSAQERQAIVNKNTATKKLSFAPNKPSESSVNKSNLEIVGYLIGLSAAEADETEETNDKNKDASEKLEGVLKNTMAGISIVIPLILYLCTIFSFVGYMQARIGNLVWNNTTLDQFAFKSSLRARDLIWLYATNIVCIALTFGLATPWAQIRMAKYRTSKLHIVGDVSFDQFVGEKKGDLKAAGEEIADMFDIDLSFG